MFYFSLPAAYLHWRKNTWRGDDFIEVKQAWLRPLADGMRNNDTPQPYATMPACSAFGSTNRGGDGSVTFHR